MSDLCQRLREKLGKEGPGHLLDDVEAEEHLASCPSCFAFLEELNRLDRVLEALPHVDVEQTVIAGVLDAVANADASSPKRRAWKVLLAASLAAFSLVVWVAIYRTEIVDRCTSQKVPTASSATDEARVVVPAAPVEPRPDVPRVVKVAERNRRAPVFESIELPPEPTFAPPSNQAAAAVAPPSPPIARAARPEIPATQAVRAPELAMAGVVGGAIGGLPGGNGSFSIRVRDAAGVPLPGATVTIGDASGSIRTRAVVTDANGLTRIGNLPPRESYWVEASFPTLSPVRHEDVHLGAGSEETLDIALVPEMRERVVVHAERDVIDIEQTQISTTFSDEFIADLPSAGRSYANVIAIAPGVQDTDGDGNPNVHGSRNRNFTAVVGGLRNVDPLTGQRLSEANPNAIEEMEVITAVAGVEFGRAQGGFANLVEVGSSQGGRRASAKARRAAAGKVALRDEATDEARERAREFLEERATIEGLTYRPATGYWANTYLPGDPMLRLLGMRLGNTPAGTTLPVSRLHGAAHRASVPFDPPQDAALGLYVASDRTGLNEPSRMLVQVGIQATPVRGSRRPPMSVAAVLDLRGELSQETAASMRALIDALRQARDPGDRFSVFVAGRAGGRIAGPDDLRYGYLSVTLNAVLAGGEPLEGPTLDLPAALEAAQLEVSAADDPSRPVGSSAVLLITSQALGDDREPIRALAGQGVLEGVLLSAIAVGSAVDPSELESLVLAGQGSLRIVAAPAEAAAVIQRELGAVSRVVARAVRLSIRLAKGVRLVDVLGSDWLDPHATDRVRQVQTSIDQRTRQSLGIARDREREREDDGIQIFIPNFHAGDSHVVLLDVVADGPGPVAEVQMRFKDLVGLRNGTARVSLDLGRGTREPGPLERNVLKNLLVLELASCLESAGTYASERDRASATDVLGELTDLLVGLRAELPDLGADPDLGGDLAMLRAYIDTLAESDLAQLAWLGDSMRYAARLEVLPTSRAN